MAKGISKVLALLFVSMASLASAADKTQRRVLGTSVNAENTAGKVRDLLKSRGEHPPQDITTKTGGPRKLKQKNLRKLQKSPEKGRHYFSGGTRGGKGKGYYPEDPWYYPTEYPKGGHPTYVPGTFYPEHDSSKYYPGGKGKGKGGNSKHSKASKGSGNGKGKGKGGIHYEDDFYPTVDDIPFFDDQFFDDAYFDDDDCELVTFNETFSFAGPSLFLAPDTDITTPGTPSLPGTVFIFEEASIFELQTDDVVIEGTTINGVCTRTTVGEDGGGMCQFTFVDDEGYTINVSGYLQGPFGSQLAITGGTGSTTGVVGSMDFFPTFGDLTDPEAVGDIFLDTTRFDVIADIGIIVCPSPNAVP